MLESGSFRKFDPWLVTDRKYVRTIAQNVAGAYSSIRPRQRKLRTYDKKNVEIVTRAILANVAYAVAMGDDLPIIAVSLRASKRKLTRYDRSGFAILPKLLEVLSEGGLIELRKSDRRGVTSSYVPSDHLLADLKRFRLASEHFAWEHGIETINLSVTTRDYSTQTRSVEPIDYEDTDETRRFREEMTRLNKFLGTAKFNFLDDDGPPVLTSHRDLVRYFKLNHADDKPNFDLGGRLFNGWWQGLSSDRRSHIRIRNEPVADLDFSAAFLRLAHIEAGVIASDGDLYANVPGIDGQQYRAGLKKIINSMFFRDTPLIRIPSDAKPLLPRGITGKEIREAILSAFPAIRHVFESGIGLRLMFRESQVMVRSLSRLMDLHVPAMCMHDGLMVQRSKADIAAREMASASAEILGQSLPIKLKTLYK
ncbi:hypothetical protein ASC80_12945 [Afipia sp. Root123D2]|nr:hypothetical protein ASC80_12945 [Afipia sp. Root123D2]